MNIHDYNMLTTCFDFVYKLQCRPRTQLVRDTVIINNRGLMVHVRTITLSGLSKSDALEFARRNWVSVINLTLYFVYKLQCRPRTHLVRDTVIINNMGFMVHVLAITLSGLSKSDAVEFARRMGFSESCADQAGEWILRLYDLFIERDATLIEINPMTEDLLGRGMCCRYNVYLN